MHIILPRSQSMLVGMLDIFYHSEGKRIFLVAVYYRYMWNSLLRLYDTIFPPHESVLYLKKETPEGFIRHFSPHTFANSIVLSHYENPIIRAAVTANKFHDNEKAATLLAVLIEHWLATLPEAPTIFVPMPLSSTRRKERGYNQVTRVLEHSRCQIEIQELLVRNKHTKPQTTLQRDERFKNVENAFTLCKLEVNFSTARIIIIDDVVTTGATMRAAYTTLLPHVPKDCEIICLALSH